MPLTHQPKRAPTREILAAIKTKLVSDEIAVADAIAWAARYQAPRDFAERGIILQPKGFLSRRADRDGGGRVDGQLRRILAVHLRLRLALDEADRDDLWLLKEAEGYFDLEDAVLDTLDLFWPHDSQGNALLVEPMRATEGSEAGKDERDYDWGKATLYFEMIYHPPLDQAQQ